MQKNDFENSLVDKIKSVIPGMWLIFSILYVILALFGAFPVSPDVL